MTTLLMVVAVATNPLTVTASPVESTLLISAPELEIGSRYVGVVISANGFPLEATRVASNQWQVKTDAPYGEFLATLRVWGKDYPVTSSWLRPEQDLLDVSDVFVGGAFGFIAGMFVVYILRNILIW